MERASGNAGQLSGNLDQIDRMDGDDVDVVVDGDGDGDGPQL